MKTITTLLIATAASFSLNVSANSFLNETVEDEYNHNSSMSEPTIVSSLGSSWDTSNQLSYLNESIDEEYNYIDPASEQNIASILSELDNNPPAAGRRSASQNTFLNETVEDEHQH
jgi:hypothetical protein